VDSTTSVHVNPLWNHTGTFRYRGIGNHQGLLFRFFEFAFDLASGSIHQCFAVPPAHSVTVLRLILLLPDSYNDLHTTLGFHGPDLTSGLRNYASRAPKCLRYGRYVDRKDPSPSPSLSQSASRSAHPQPAFTKGSTTLRRRGK